MNTCKCLKNKNMFFIGIFGSINNTLHPLNALMVLNSGKRFFRLLKNIIHTKKKHGSFKKLFIEKFFAEPKMVLPWHYCKSVLLENIFLRNESN